MKKQVIAIALVLLTAGCIQIVEKNPAPPNTNQNSGLVEPLQLPETNVKTQDQNEPQAQTDLNRPKEPAPEPIPEPDQNQPDDSQERQSLPPIPVARPAWVELFANTRMISLNEGKFVEINGTQNFTGTKFKVVLESIASTGGEFVARFRLETIQGEQIDKKTFTTGDDVTFEDASGNAIPFDGVLTIDGVYVG